MIRKRGFMVLEIFKNPRCIKNIKKLPAKYTADFMDDFELHTSR